MIPAAAAEAVPEYLRGSDNATTVRAMLARLERLNTDGARKESQAMTRGTERASHGNG